MEMLTTTSHIPVLSREVIENLGIQPGGRYIDCTLGTGKHALSILEHSYPGGQLLGIDADPEALNIARNRLGAFSRAILLVNDNFVNLQDICVKYDFFPVHGILLTWGFPRYNWTLRSGVLVSSGMNLWTCVLIPIKN